jgi:hypothetical protein
MQCGSVHIGKAIVKGIGFTPRSSCLTIAKGFWLAWSSFAWDQWWVVISDVMNFLCFQYCAFFSFFLLLWTVDFTRLNRYSDVLNCNKKEWGKKKKVLCKVPWILLLHQHWQLHYTLDLLCSSTSHIESKNIMHDSLLVSWCEWVVPLYAVACLCMRSLTLLMCVTIIMWQVLSTSFLWTQFVEKWTAFSHNCINLLTTLL